MGDSIFTKFKSLVGIEDIEDDEEDVVEQKSAMPERKALDPKANMYTLKTDGDSRDKEKDVRPSLVSRVTMANQFSNQFKMLVIEPKGFEECPRLVDSLKAKKPVIINLETVESETARKIFDFLSGATYALNGNVQKVANNIFIFAPENVDVSVPLEPKMSFGDKGPWR